MKFLKLSILACSLLLAGQAAAQTAGGPPKESLNAAPVTAPAPQVEAEPTEAAKPASTATLPLNRMSYNLSLGTMFGSGLGASYIEPSARYHVSDRFRVHGSFTYMNVTSQPYIAFTPEGGTVMRNAGPSSHYIVSAGVDYLASDRLILSGNVWKDFSNVPAQNPMYNGLFSPGRQGADIRATYKITENFSVTGGVRYSDGASPFMSPFYGPGFGGYRGNGFW